MSTDFNQVLHLDSATGLVTVQAGIMWPKLMSTLDAMQQDVWPQWCIQQKQTGADDLTIGGSISANIHGRGLTLRPFVHDIEWIKIVNADAQVIMCDKKSELFSLVCGGYGLFGVVAEVCLKLVRRSLVKRCVQQVKAEDAVSLLEDAIAQGFAFGDVQFSIDNCNAENFMSEAIMSCYLPLPESEALKCKQNNTAASISMNADHWKALNLLSHVNKQLAVEIYSQFYLASHGQKYWSDTHQLALYIPDYHSEYIDKVTHSACSASEIITELYVPRKHFKAWLAQVKAYLLANQVSVIYGTIRLIEKDDISSCDGQQNHGYARFSIFVHNIRNMALLLQKRIFSG